MYVPLSPVFVYIFNVRLGWTWAVRTAPGRIDFEIIPRKNILNSHFDFFLRKNGVIRNGRIISWGCFNHKTSKILVNLSNAFWLIATIPRGIHRSVGLLSIFFFAMLFLVLPGFFSLKTKSPISSYSSIRTVFYHPAGDAKSMKMCTHFQREFLWSLQTHKHGKMSDRWRH